MEENIFFDGVFKFIIENDEDTIKQNIEELFKKEKMKVSKERFEIFEESGKWLIKDNGKLPSLLDSYLCCVRLNKFIEQISDLEAKLAEKEKLIEFYINSGKEQCEEINKLNHRALNYCDEIDKVNQDKISFAVDKLMGIQKYISDNAVYIEEESFGREINDFIDNQIKQLKEGE